MSGPIEISVMFAAATLAMIQARRIAELTDRAARTKARLIEERDAAAQRAATIREQMARQRTIAAKALSDAVHLKQQSASDEGRKRIRASSPSQGRAVPTVENATISTDSSASAPIIQEPQGNEGANDVDCDTTARPLAITPLGADEELVNFSPLVSRDSFRDTLEELLAWQKVLAGEPAVSHFRQGEASTWCSQVDTLLKEVEHSDASSVMLRVQPLLASAHKIYDDAGQAAARFATRNELLHEMIGSLKEIGYFVKDPELTNPADPTSAVIVTAIRGTDEMVANVDFSDTIQSVWNGNETDHCKYAFSNYVDSMKARGIELSTARQDLQERPNLIQRGAKDLPQRDQKQR